MKGIRDDWQSPIVDCEKRWAARPKSAARRGSNNMCRGSLAPLHYCEDHEERKQHQRLNQSQSQNHHGLDATCCSRIASRALTRRSTNPRLTKRATKYGDGKTNASCQRPALTY